MVRLWGLPDDLAAAVAKHHDPFVRGGIAAGQEPGGHSIARLPACVCIADHMAQLLWAGVHYETTPGPAPGPGGDTTEPSRVLAARDALQLGHGPMQSLMQAARELYPLVG